MRSSIMAVTCLASVLGMSGCGHRESPPPTGATRPLRLGIDRWPGFYPALLAEDLGLFGQEGVDVDVRDVRIPTSSDRMVAEFAAGRYDAVTVAIGDVISLLETDPDVRLVLLTDESLGADVVLASPGIHSVAELRGRRIGTHLGGFGEVFVRRMLEMHGIRGSEVTLVNVNGPDVPSRIESGVIAAGNTWTPWTERGTRLGQRVLFTSKETPGLILDGVVVHGDTLADPGRRSQAARLIRAWFAASSWWVRHPAEGARRLSRRLGLPPDQVGLHGIHLLDASENRSLLAVTAGKGSAVESIQYLVDFYVRRGTLSRRLSPNEIVDSSLLPPEGS